jgi:hypothetical protein
MNKKMLLVLLLLFSCTLIVRAQIIESFDNIAADTTYQLSIEGGSTMTITPNTVDKVEGEASLSIYAMIGAIHEWGSYAQLIKRLPATVPPMDWSISDTLSIWIKVTQAPALPENMVFRIHLADRLAEDGAIEEYIYENATILDALSDWFQLKIPLFERPTDGGTIPNDEGFVLFPKSWGGGSYNNEKLDLDKIIGFNITAVTSGYTPGANIPADSLTYLVDKFERTGMRSIPAIIFNGMALPAILTSWAWGQSSIELAEGAGATPGTNALKWVQGNEWGNGWTGIGFTVNPTFNLAGAWQQDSVKFKLKCDEGVGALRMQFEGGAGKVGTVFSPIADNQWHSYALPLREMVYQDNTSGFDSSSVHVVGLMAEASATAGKVIYIDDWWTGNPEFDVIPPVKVQQVLVVPGTYVNLVTWQDVPGEDQEVYNIYYSENPITDLTDVEVVKFSVPENNQVVEHILRAPVTDQSVTYYYAVTCTDKSGNTSEATAYDVPTTNTAKGVVTVSLNAPTSTFNADGDLSEWANITPIHMAPSGGGYVVTNTTITNDADLTVDAYIAMDDTYLYAAFDIEDDIVSHASPTSYLNDCPDLFIGLYNWHGKPHTAYKRGAEPDYHFRFAFDRALIDGVANGDNLLLPGTEYYWGEKFPTGYVVEARIPWTLLADRTGDDLFVPVEGYRVPLDFSINDADATGEREGIMCYSPFNEDQSWNNVSRWLYTWIGNLWYPVSVFDKENIAYTYELNQNYPNPFNPSTKLNYTIEKDGMVSLKVYDILGRLVTTLVDTYQPKGTYTVSFDASNLPSGMYLYKIESGSYSSVKKMMLIK